MMVQPESQQPRPDQPSNHLDDRADGNPLVSRVREETQPLHDKLEETRLSARLESGEVDWDDFAQVMAIHQRIHHPIEASLEGLSDGRVSEAWQQVEPKLEAIEQDRQRAEEEGGRVDPAGLEPADNFARSVREDRHPPAAWLLGALYVLEGSTLGGVLLRKRLARGLGLSPSQLHYYGIYGRQTMPRWQAFLASFEEALDCQSEYETCISGAVRTFEVYHDCFEAAAIADAETAGEPVPAD